MSKRIGRIVGVGDGGFGDQGKAKVIDAVITFMALLGWRILMVYRVNGGGNAGHTVIDGLKKFIFHYIPTGAFVKGILCCLGPGMVIDPVVFFEEIRSLGKQKISLADRLFVSDKASLIFPWHRWLEKAHEQAQGGRKIGTTGKGIGLAYASKAERWYDLRVGDVLFPEDFRRKYLEARHYYGQILRKVFGLSEGRIRQYHQECEASYQAALRLKPLVRDTEKIAHEVLASGCDVLVEGAQGAMLDVTYGTRPYVTSSATTLPGLLYGAGLGHFDHFYCVLKAYLTRVGEGIMVGEMKGAYGRHLREIGVEKGSTTGRERRVAPLDLVLMRQFLRLNSSPHFPIEWALTKLDVLDNLEFIKVITHYELDGEFYEDLPSTDPRILARCRPIMAELPGWLSKTGHCRRWKELPRGAQDYARFIREELGCHIPIIGIGEDRQQTILVAEKAFFQ